MGFFVMTWNIKSGHFYDPRCGRMQEENLAGIARTIKNTGAAVAFLQEVDAYTGRSGRDVHQAGYIAEILGWYYKYITSIKMYPGYYGNAIISRYPLEVAGRLHLKARRDREDRSFLLVRAGDGEKRIFFGTFHLGLGDQEEQAREIKDFLFRNGYGGEKIVLGGDLNACRGTVPYEIICHRHFSLHDAGPRGGCTFQCYESSDNPRIDFCFLNRLESDSRRNTVPCIDISDHRPVLVYIRA